MIETKSNNNYTISEIQYQKCESMLDALSNLTIPPNYLVFIYGMGKQTKSTYQEIEKQDDVEVVWYDFLLSGMFRVFKYFIAGYTGLIKIENMATIKNIFEKVAESSMAGIYIIDKKIESIFINEIKNKNKDIFIVNELVISHSNNYFIYIIDNDPIDSDTGIFEIKSVGERSFLKNKE